MTRKQMEKFLRNPKFIGIKMPDLHGRIEGLEKRLQSKIRDKSLINLLEKMLQMEPSDRSTCAQCLEHEWFDSVRTKCINWEIELWRELGINNTLDIQLNTVSVKNDEQREMSKQ